MRINHNLAALNTIRQLGINSNNTQKALEKLSSGLRINSAADDAAGLAISEKMRGQISGLEMAQKNAQDGISLISTAEGALNETHSILQRMRELAVQSSNDTNTDDDRKQLQKEMDQLSSEVTRISTDTQFNGKNLLNGTFTGTFQIGANAGQDITLSIGKMDSTQLGITGQTTSFSGGSVSGLTSGVGITISGVGTYAGDNASGVTVDTSSLTVTSGFTSSTAGVSNVTGFSAAASGSVTWTDAATGSAGVSGVAGTVNVSGFNFTIDDSTATGTSGTLDLSDIKNVSSGYTAAAVSGNVITFSGASGSFTYDATGKLSSGSSASVSGVSAHSADGQIQAGEITLSGSYSGASASVTSGGIHVSGASGSFDVSQAKLSGGSAVNVAVQSGSVYGGSVKVGDTTFTVASDGTATAASGTYKGLTVKATGTSTPGTTSGSFNITGRTSTVSSGTVGLDIQTRSGASSAITAIDNAINQVSTERSKLGAYQNRLEHTINNLGTSSQNLTAAESRIRDVDMAKEMAEFTKNNILNQAAQAMLAQANNLPQGVLQLLR